MDPIARSVPPFFQFSEGPARTCSQIGELQLTAVQMQLTAVQMQLFRAVRGRAATVGRPRLLGVAIHELT